MQREILERYETPGLRVYAVWLPFVGATRQGADVSQRVLSDARVIHYWDGAATTSDWFAGNVDNSAAPSWDVYYLYGTEARWAEIPGPLTSSGGTVIGRSSELKEAITPLLQAS